MYARTTPPKKDRTRLSPEAVAQAVAEGTMTLEEVRVLAAGKKGGAKRKLIEIAGGEPAQDATAEFERVMQLQAEAAARPRRPPRQSGRPPSNEYQRMTTSQLIERIDPDTDVNPITGELLHARRPSDPPLELGDYQTSEARLRAAGLETVLDLMGDGHSIREISRQLGVRQAHLNRWLASIPDGENRVREARVKAAQAWLDRGLAAIEDAETLAALAKAREIAAMCRKYAAIADPSFSDRVQVDTTVKAEDQASIDAKLRLIMNQVAQKRVKDAEQDEA